MQELIDCNYIGKIKEIKFNTAIIKSIDQNINILKIGDIIRINTTNSFSSSVCYENVLCIIVKISYLESFINEFYTDEENNSQINKVDVNTGIIDTILIGQIDKDEKFERSITISPSVNNLCYKVTADLFKKIFISCNSSTVSIGKYKYYGGEVNVDGNKFFQRHCSILGSTGSGKSWTLASILEKANKLNSSNLIVFDLHGEYNKLNYVKHLQIPGPEELYSDNKKLLYLPFWLLDAGDLNTLFISKNDFTAHNQISIFQTLILREKKNFLKSNNLDHELLDSFTINSPIPFDLDSVINNLSEKNTEMITGSRGGVKQGTFYGQFSRMLARICNKINDKRYGFIFSAPTSEHLPDSLSVIAKKLMDTIDDTAKIKVIDFSSVPVDILPIIISVVAKLIYTIQFWMTTSERSPISLVLDEAHIYLPTKEGQKNPNLAKCANTFEKIAKEGRKNGISLFVVSQRPTDISETILSQINNFIILKLTNYRDRTTIEKLLPDSFSSLLENLSVLKIGEGIIVGDSVAFPALTMLDKPLQPPLSKTIAFWDTWNKPKVNINFSKAISNLLKQSKN